MPTRPNRARRPSSRGLSVSVLVCLLIPVLLLCAGLAVDGAAKAAADRQAEAIAAQAARAGMDAAAPGLVDGGDGVQDALAAARQVLARHPGMAGEAVVRADGTLEVTTSTQVPTVFLGLAGVDQLPGRGRAEVVLRPR